MPIGSWEIKQKASEQRLCFLPFTIDFILADPISSSRLDAHENEKMDRVNLTGWNGLSMEDAFVNKTIMLPDKIASVTSEVNFSQPFFTSIILRRKAMPP